LSSTHYAGFRLTFAGLALFFFGLMLGFAVSVFPSVKPLLSAHEAALGSGTFLISIGAVWSLYMKSDSRMLIPAIWTSHYALAGALLLDGFGGAQRLAVPLLALSCVAVAITTLILIGQFWLDTRAERVAARPSGSAPLAAEAE
jgi:hypothetical protein